MFGRPFVNGFGASDCAFVQSAMQDDSPIVTHTDGQTGDVCVKIGDYTYPINLQVEELEPTNLDHMALTYLGHHAEDNRRPSDVHSKEFKYTKVGGLTNACCQNRRQRDRMNNCVFSEIDRRILCGGHAFGEDKRQLDNQQFHGQDGVFSQNCDLTNLDHNGSINNNCASIQGLVSDERKQQWYTDLAQYGDDFHFVPHIHSCYNKGHVFESSQSDTISKEFGRPFPNLQCSSGVYTHDDCLLMVSENVHSDSNGSNKASDCSASPDCARSQSALMPGWEHHYSWVHGCTMYEYGNQLVTKSEAMDKQACRGNMPPMHRPGDVKQRSDDDNLFQHDRDSEQARLKLDIKRQLKKMKRGCRLWEFIRNLLLDPSTNPSLIRWENREEGTFKLVQSKAIAHKWGMKKGNEGMTYEKLSRAMRYYYKRQVFQPVLGKRLVYRFGPRATGWRDK